MKIKNPLSKIKKTAGGLLPWLPKKNALARMQDQDLIIEQLKSQVDHLTDTLMTQDRVEYWLEEEFRSLGKQFAEESIDDWVMYGGFGDEVRNTLKDVDIKVDAEIRV